MEQKKSNAKCPDKKAQGKKFVEKSANKKTDGRRRSYSRESSANLPSAKRDNDPNWYFTDNIVAEQVSSFAFDQYAGKSFKMDYTYPTSASQADATTTSVYIPTICAIKMNPSPGNTTDVKTGINIAALKMYSLLSSNNAKTTNYAPQDLTMLMLSLGEVLSTIEHVRRVFGVAFTYNQRNRNLPRKLISMMGVNVDDFLGNMANYRMRFNSIITAINKIPFLDNVAYMYKCASIYSKVYADSESAMAQIAFMRPNTVWILDEVGDEQGSILDTFALSDSYTMNDILDLLDRMINALLTSTTFNYIYSDILNYSSKTGAKLLFVPLLESNYVVVPEYNRNFSLQFHNSTALGNPHNVVDTKYNNTKGNNVHCDVDKNKVRYEPLFLGVGNTQLFIDMDTPEASVVDRIEATRYAAPSKFVGISSDNNHNFCNAMLPDHYVVAYQVDTDETTVEDITSNHLFAKSSSVSYTNLAPMLALNMFDWGPMLFIDRGASASSVTTRPLTDLNYYTTLDTKWFERVNDFAFQGLFTLR